MPHLFPDLEIIDTPHLNVHQDWEVPIPAFFIIAAKREIDTVSEFTDAEAIEFINLVRRLRQGITEVLGIEKVYLFQNEHTQYHFHFWLFPRFPWMDEFGMGVESVRPIIDHAKGNMTIPEVISDVEKYASEMREYMDNRSK